MPVFHAYIKGTSKDNTKAILDEFYKEFISQGKRLWDLRRTSDSFVLDNNDFLSLKDEFKLLFPITEDMIGRNPFLDQTTWYTN